jgi:hypothetical protein
MNSDQPSRRYSGVTRHAKKWLAKFRFRGRDLNIGHYEAPELAAWVADFARYLCFGLNPAMWHPNVGRPNHSPLSKDEYSRAFVIRKLLRATDLDVGLLHDRLVEYDLLANGAECDAVVEQNAACCACR